MNKISVIKIVPSTIVDGDGLRTSVYFAGCSHQCPGCHNPESWDINFGTFKDVNALAEEIISYGSKKITLTGGDPIYQKTALLELIKALHALCKDINIWLYTGYTLEELIQTNDSVILQILYLCNVLVDGRYIEKLRNDKIKFRGSDNQRILYLAEELKDFLDMRERILQYPSVFRVDDDSLAEKQTTL